MKEVDFEKLVKKALQALPKNIREKMDNVAIVVEKRPSLYELQRVGTRIGNSLLGLYQGIPQATWGRGFGQILPDKITIFQESIQRLAATKQEVAELVKMVLWHEIAHHFGFSEKGVRNLEAKWRKRSVKIKI